MNPTQIREQIKELAEKTVRNISEKAPEKAKALKELVDQYGGVSGLVHALNQPEFKQKLGTWIGDGKKFVMSQEQVQKFLGDERVKTIAAKIQTTPEQVTKVLSEVLPPLVEKLELASKKIPEGSVVSKLLGTVKNFLGAFPGTTTHAAGPTPETKPTPTEAEKH